jgi:TctA family transporter
MAVTMDNAIRFMFILSVVYGAAYAKKSEAKVASAPGLAAAVNTVFDITELGAVADGKTDSTKVRSHAQETVSFPSTSMYVQIRWFSSRFIRVGFGGRSI